MGPRALVSDRSNDHWWHFALLLGVLSIFEGGRMVVASDAPFMLPVLTRGLYSWIPALGGIAISIRRPDGKLTRDGIQIGCAGAVLMVALDIWGGMLLTDLRETAVLMPGGSVFP